MGFVNRKLYDNSGVVLGALDLIGTDPPWHTLSCIDITF